MKRLKIVQMMKDPREPEETENSILLLTDDGQLWEYDFANVPQLLLTDLDLSVMAEGEEGPE